MCSHPEPQPFLFWGGFLSVTSMALADEWIPSSDDGGAEDILSDDDFQEEEGLAEESLASACASPPSPLPPPVDRPERSRSPPPAHARKAGRGRCRLARLPSSDRESPPAAGARQGRQGAKTARASMEGKSGPADHGLKRGSSDQRLKSARGSTGRHSDNKPSSPQAMNMLCVWGKPVKHPVVVQPVQTDANGKKWIVLNEHLHWLRRACAPEGSTHYRELFQSAISELRRVLRMQLEKKHDAAGAEQSKLREDLGLDVDGDEAPPVNGKRRGVAQEPEISVVLNGTPFMVKTRIRPITVECTTIAVDARIAFCTQHVRAGKSSLKQHLAGEKSAGKAQGQV